MLDKPEPDAYIPVRRRKTRPGSPVTKSSEDDLRIGGVT